MTAHDDAMPDDITDAEAFHFEGEFEGDDVRVQILRAQPGDIVVLSWPCPVRPEQVDQIKQGAARFLPAGVSVAVMDSGGHVDSVVRPA